MTQEHGGVLYSHSPHYEYMSGYREVDRIADIYNVVGVGGPGLPWRIAGEEGGGYGDRDR